MAQLKVYKNVENSMAVVKGTRFELKVLDILQQRSFKLTRVGGAMDRGVDLRGYLLNKPIIIQCKDESNKSGSKHIRSLEGALSTEPSTIGCLATTSDWTLEAVKCFQNSKFAMMGLVIEDDIKSCFVNLEMQRLLPLHVQKSLDGKVQFLLRQPQ